jgi:hypothetical protein
MASRELRSKIRQFQHDSFHVTQFTIYTVSSVVSSIMIYWSAAIWLTPGGSSTVHIYTQIQRTIQIT